MAVLRRQLPASPPLLPSACKRATAWPKRGKAVNGFDLTALSADMSRVKKFFYLSSNLLYLQGSLQWTVGLQDFILGLWVI